MRHIGVPPDPPGDPFAIRLGAPPVPTVIPNPRVAFKANPSGTAPRPYGPDRLAPAQKRPAAWWGLLSGARNHRLEEGDGQRHLIERFLLGHHALPVGITGIRERDRAVGEILSSPPPIRDMAEISVLFSSSC